MFRHVTHKKRKISRAVLHAAAVFSVFFVDAAQENKAYACMTCNGMVTTYNSSIWDRSERQFMQKVNDEFLRLERFIVYEMWRDSILPIMMLSAEQFSAVAMQQAMMIGMMMDAKHQLETQQLLQVLQARANKDYHPSEGMCEFGTVMKALAASERRSEYTSFILSQRSQDRQLGSSQTSGTYGGELDKNFRISQFKSTFCAHSDRNNALATICTDMPWSTMTPEQMDRLNSDIDFFRTVDAPWTMRIDFTNDIISDTAATPPVHNEDDEHVFALASNLFADKLFVRAPAKTLEFIPEQPLTNMQQAYMDMRAIVAKRSVAENSFNAITSAKAEGVMAVNKDGEPVNDSAGNPMPMRSRPFMESIVRNLGVSSADALKLLGENPSYNAQMEVLTKKIFQSPDFYTNLYDKPMNVKRKGVTLQAIRMMQKFDMLKSFLRSEASFSVLLENAVVDLQTEIEDEIRVLDTGSR
jgi:hypothetical protein